MTVSEIMDEIKRICEKYGVKGAVLFGSRAKGTATDRSDFDVAVYGCREFEELKEEIEEIPTLHSFDIVNMETCSNDLLAEDIKQYGRKIL